MNGGINEAGMAKMVIWVGNRYSVNFCIFSNVSIIKFSNVFMLLSQVYSLRFLFVITRSFIDPLKEVRFQISMLGKSTSSRLI